MLWLKELISGTHGQILRVFEYKTDFNPESQIEITIDAYPYGRTWITIHSEIKEWFSEPISYTDEFVFKTKRGSHLSRRVF